MSRVSSSSARAHVSYAMRHNNRSWAGTWSSTHRASSCSRGRGPFAAFVLGAAADLARFGQRYRVGGQVAATGQTNRLSSAAQRGGGCGWWLRCRVRSTFRTHPRSAPVVTVVMAESELSWSSRTMFHGADIPHAGSVRGTQGLRGTPCSSRCPIVRDLDTSRGVLAVTWRVVVYVAFAVSPVLLLLTAMLLTALFRAVTVDDYGLLHLVWGFFSFGVFGVAGSFALHEAAHAGVLTLCRNVRSARLQLTLMRLSVQPMGEMTAVEMAALCLAGPAFTAAVGVGLWVIQPQSLLAWAFLAHIIFLIPVFGDGRGLVTALRLRHTAA